MAYCFIYIRPLKSFFSSIMGKLKNKFFKGVES